MELLLMVLFIALIITYITIYVVKGKGLWENIEVYTPNWSEKALVITFFYLFVILIILSWYFNHIYFKNSLLNNLNTILFILILVLFSFFVFCLSDGNTSIEEAFVLSTMVLTLLVINLLFTFMFNKVTSKIFSLLPLILYTYIYAWVYEIKNNN